ncbi:hypothetical protein APHAL10511_001516 [Amanita phalloides]|nr:hypothetical protein APHAL10511_001516 [Amanita phalloides]
MSSQRQNSSLSVLILRYGNFRPLVTTQRRSLSAIELIARQHFRIPADAKINFSTTFVADELMQVDPAVWLQIYTTVSTLWIELEEAPPLCTPAPQNAPPPTIELDEVPPNAPPRTRLTRVFVETLDRKRIPIFIESYNTVIELMEKIQGRISWPLDLQRLIFAGKQLEADRCLEDYNIPDDSTIYFVSKLRGGKPVIYLYPPTSLSVDVDLSLVPAWEFSAIYPLAPVKTESISLGREAISWNVFAEPGGKLRLSDGLEVSYLYWEAETRALPEIATPPASRPQTPGSELSSQPFNPAKPVLTPQDSVLLRVPADLTKYLDQALLSMGLHTEARTSFITYWLPSFMKHEYVALRFLEQSAYESAARLDITPRPDVVTRVFMLFRGVSSRDLAVWAEAERRTDDMHITQWRTIVGVDVERMGREDLFRVLEWGGMEVLP